MLQYVGGAPYADNRRVAARARLGRLREVARGAWRNPALTAEAREKLSRPRKHTGALAAAIEKLGRGLRMADLTGDERQAHRAYRRSLRNARLVDDQRYHRDYYRRKMDALTPDQRQAQQARWRAARRRRRQK